MNRYFSNLLQDCQGVHVLSMAVLNQMYMYIYMLYGPKKNCTLNHKLKVDKINCMITTLHPRFQSTKIYV